jgi:hypothetical protein
MEEETQTICPSETSVDFQRTTRRYVPEDSILMIIELIITDLPTIGDLFEWTNLFFSVKNDYLIIIIN